MSQAAALDAPARNLHWRTRGFVAHATDTHVTAVDIVQQLTTDLGGYVVLAVDTTEGSEYFVVVDATGFALYPATEYDTATAALDAHLTGTDA